MDEFVGWRFIFWEVIPLGAVSGTMIWFGVKQDPPEYERIPLFDWPGAILVIIGAGALTTMLEQGDRYDWFNSQTICLLALASVVGLGLLGVNEPRQPLPLYKFDLLKKRNLAYALIALFTFLLLNLAASTIPATYLQEVVRFRPIQIQLITLPIALAQFVTLPVVALLLDFEHVDARVVTFIGLLLIISACIGDSLLTTDWQPGEFYLWQACYALGEPMIVLPLLMIATNSLRNPAEGPFASTLVNSMRAIAEPVGVWMIQLITRWRGALHYNRLADDAGSHRFSVIQGAGLLPGNLPPLLANGQPRVPGSLAAFAATLRAQAMVLTLSDAFLVVAVLAAALLAVLFVLPARTYPPRIEFAKT